MRLAKFLLKYFLFRSTRNPKNIENVIRSQGFDIFEYDPEESGSPLIKACKCEFHAKAYPCFTYANKNVKDVFIQESLTKEDRIISLFHEEGHIWYDHPFKNGFTDNTNIQQEETANFFLFRLRLLKVATYTLFFAALLSTAFLLLRPLNNGATVADEGPQAVLQTAALTIEEDPIPEELPAQEEEPIPEELLIAEASAEPAIEPTAEPVEESTSATVYITPSGERYHRPDCYHIEGRPTTGLTITEAENFSKTPCKTCQP